ncbi:MAG: MgtE integral membrane protein [Candidatus Peregrinibacteria bacterium GW2011_GWC2_39_14]|nr:MAG: MgtE intracellular region [Candidatus Peregrinibacteria bacterium GW2011_GWA2_38_36]KKR06589.1 MAG: MgtE integral membrane protein [Candidatus Peregrinibacteria bacterium GW2011_GWC2_39_14]
MIFFAHYLNAEVVDATEKTIGKLKDMIARGGEDYPFIEAIVVEKGDKQMFIPISYAENFAYDEITLKIRSEKIEQYKSSLKDFWLYRDIVDKQIVDISGTRVVRVNDIQLGKVEDRIRILGIDMSTRGLLRRVGVEKWRIFRSLEPKLIDWKNVQLVNGALRLKTVSNDLKKLHAADLANILEELTPKQGISLINALEPEKAAKVFQELNPMQRRLLVDLLGEDQAREVLDNVPTDDLADYVKTLNLKETKRIFSYLKRDKRMTVEKFIEYPNDTAGGLMTSDFVEIDPDWTVEEATTHIKNISNKYRSIFFVYIVDKAGKLFGVISARTLLIKDPMDPMRKIMKPLKKIHTVHPATDVKKVAEIMTKYNLFSIAVTDKHHKLLGIITVDDVMRCLMPYS